MSGGTNVTVVTGPGHFRLSGAAYAMIIRMLAENIKMARIQRAAQTAHPDDEIPYSMINRIKRNRQPEIKELRKRLNAELDDLWIAQKRQRIIGLQQIYEDCNRWVPEKILVVGKASDDDDDGGPSSVVSYRKNVDGMLKALKQVRDELGESAGEKQASALEMLVKMAERERGLQQTIDVEAVPDFDTVPELRDAQLLEIEGEVRTKGADKAKGFLDGGAGDANAHAEALTAAVGGDAPGDDTPANSDDESRET